MAQRVRAFDWSQTPLGPMEQWPEALRVAVDICLSSRFPMFVWWGSQQINIYNDGYVPMLGERHPAALGRPARDSWSDIWDVVGPQAEAVLQRGDATWNERVKLVMERNGYPEDTYFTWSYSPIRDGSGRIAGMFCAVTEETQHVRAEAERDRLAAQRQVALDAAGMGWWHYDPQTRNRTYDRRVMEIFGLTGQQPGRDELLDRVHPEDRPALLASVQAALDPREPKPYDIQYRIIRDDGSVRWIEAHGLATFDGDGDSRRAVSFVGTIADITERRRVAEQPRIILESVTDAFFALDREWKFTYFNSGAERLLMRRQDELLGRNLWEEFPAAIGTAFDREYRRAMAEHVTVEFEEYYPPPLEAWYSVRAFPSREGLSVYFRNINEQRQAQERLRRTHETFYRLIHNNPFGVYVIDSDFKLLEVSLGAQKVFSNVQPLIGRDFAEILRVVWPEPFATEAIDHFRHTLDTGEAYVAMRTVEKRADITDVEAYDWRIERIILPDGRFGVVCYFYDLTERQRLDAVLRATQQRLRTAESAANVGLWELDLATGEAFWSDGLWKLVGASPEGRQPTMELWASFVHPEDREQVLSTFARDVAAGKRSVYYEFRLACGDGAVRWVNTTAQIVFDESGKAIRAYGGNQDITRRKQAEAELREARDRADFLSRALEDSSLPFASGLPDGTLLIVNPAFVALTGYDEQELRSISWATDLTPLEWREREAVWIAELIRTGQPQLYEKEYIRKDGTRISVEVKVHVSRDTQGHPLYYYAFVTDISQRKRAEAEAAALKSRLEAFIANAPVGLAMFDRSMRYVRVSRRWLSDVGLDQDIELIGRSHYELFPDLPQSWKDAHRRGLTGVACGGEDEWVAADGKPRTIRWAIHPWGDSGAETGGIIIYGEDVTERRKIEERLRTSEERLALSIDSAGLGTFYCPMPLGHIEWNAKCKEHFWLPPEAEVDMDLFYSIIHPDDRQRTREAVERAVYGHEPYDIEYRTVAPDGRQRWVRARGRAYYDSGGEPRRFDGVTLDVSDRKTVEAELRQIATERERLLEAERGARSEAERASRMKDEFLATLGHELRTPLNAIMGWVQILRRAAQADGSDDVKQGLEVIERNARAQTRIIEDLLDMSRIIAGKVRLEVQRIPLAPVIEAAVETVRPAAAAKGVNLLVALDPMADFVSGDPARLQQVFWNLLSNSVKHSQRGGYVQVLLNRKESQLEVSVIDDGEGIDPAFLPFVFDRFRQADGSTTRKHGGLGLGLSIVKQLAELHGGTVRAHSEGAGKGSTFTVALPLTPADQLHLPLHDLRHVHLDAPGSETAESEITLSQMKVLVVDDESDAREVVRRILGDAGATVFIAGSAQEGLQTLRRERPDVIVSDIGMPGEDGYAMIRQIRSLLGAAGGNTPAIALTAYARSEDRTRALRAGFTSHISKPVDPAELVATVAALARGNRSE